MKTETERERAGGVPLCKQSLNYAASIFCVYIFDFDFFDFEFLKFFIFFNYLFHREIKVR